MSLPQLLRSSALDALQPYGPLMRTALALLAAVALTGLGGCSGTSTDGAEPSAAESTDHSTTMSPTVSPSTSATAAQTTTAPPEPQWNLPNGYPKVVKASSLPAQVRSWYEMSGTARAVAVAPGVWAELRPGARMADAIDAQVYDGFCSSIKAFERRWMDGVPVAGTCW